MVAFGSVSFQDVFTKAPQLYHSDDIFITLLTLCLVLGAVAKSAQIPLYTWLPDAMEGPTPVSALIHAATMVAAGVYLLVRSYPLLSLAPFTLETIAAIGAITLIFSATMGLAQTDIKRVLAYSTISQLGYMFLGVGVGGYVASMFHLTTHAFFKALLFLAAGSVIHAIGGEQDMRKMGGLRSRIPRTYWMLVIGALALMGFPLFSGFFSKDAILTEAALSGHYVWYAVGLITTFITAFYVFRLVFLTFWGRERLGRDVSRHVHESPSTMLIPLYILAFFAVFLGFLQLPGLHLFEDFLRPTLSRFPVAGAPEVAEPGIGAFLGFAGVAALSGLLGLWLAYRMYVQDTGMPQRLAARYPALYRAVYNKYYVDQGIDRVLVRPALGFSRWLTELLDGTVVDGLVTALAEGVRGTGNGLRRLQTGYVRQYALSFLVGAVVIAGLMVSR